MNAADHVPLADARDRLSEVVERLEREHRRANRGDYRIIYEIDDPAAVVTILAIDHRSKVYRPR